MPLPQADDTSHRERRIDIDGIYTRREKERGGGQIYYQIKEGENERTTVGEDGIILLVTYVTTDQMR